MYLFIPLIISVCTHYFHLWVKSQHHLIIIIIIFFCLNCHLLAIERTFKLTPMSSGHAVLIIVLVFSYIFWLSGITG